MASQFRVFTDITFGAGALNSLKVSAGRIALVSTSAIPQYILDEQVERWKQSGTEIHLIRKPSGEPMSDDVDGAFKRLAKSIEAIIAIGGGSALDFAKAVALLAGSGGRISDYEFGARQVTAALPILAVPTTCGSGSEVTPYAVINNTRTGRKFTITHSCLIPTQAAIDPGLLRFLPHATALATSLDAFVHCLEAILTRRDARLITPFAHAGLALGWKRIPKLATGNQEEDLFEDLARLALFGGISIAHSRTGLIHTFSVAFSEFVSSPHGLLNAWLLPFALKHNLAEYGGLLASTIERCSGEKCSTDADGYALLVAWLSQVMGAHTPSTEIRLSEHKSHILNRILQDAGLPSVSHGVIDASTLSDTLDGVFDAIRC